jgi:hypothetical protein
VSSRLCAISSNLAGFDEDSILPRQYHDLSATYHLTGEQRLMFAMLVDAINVYQKGIVSRLSEPRRLAIEAEKWITRRDDTRSGFLSFESVCDTLGINPALLRRKIIVWKHAVRRADFGRYSIAGNG